MQLGLVKFIWRWKIKSFWRREYFVPGFCRGFDGSSRNPSAVALSLVISLECPAILKLRSDDQFVKTILDLVSLSSYIATVWNTSRTLCFRQRVIRLQYRTQLCWPTRTEKCAYPVTIIYFCKVSKKLVGSRLGLAWG